MDKYLCGNAEVVRLRKRYLRHGTNLVLTIFAGNIVLGCYWGAAMVQADYPRQEWITNLAAGFLIAFLGTVVFFWVFLYLTATAYLEWTKVRSKIPQRIDG